MRLVPSERVAGPDYHLERSPQPKMHALMKGMHTTEELTLLAEEG